MSGGSACRISFGCCGRFTLAELLSFSLSVMLVMIWVLTGHWLLMDGTRGDPLSLWAPVVLLTASSSPHSVGHGLVRGHDRLREAAQSEGVLPAAVGLAHLRRVLGEMSPASTSI